MKKYIRCAYMTDDEIVQRFAEDGIDTTSNPSDAIYILQDGRMIKGVYQGVRSEDHRCAECLFDDFDRYDPHFWDKLFEATGMVLVHPETNKALIGRGQSLTYEQEEILEKLDSVVTTL